MNACLIVAGAALVLAPELARAQLSEGFEGPVHDLPRSGWFIQNNSSPLGLYGFLNASTIGTWPYGPFTGTDYLSATAQSGAENSTISDWLATPPVMLENGKQFAFYTRTISAAQFGTDRLQIRMSTAGASTNVGSDPTDTGDFGALLLDVNPTYAGGGYPTTWTRFVVTLADFPAPLLGRLAMRYFVENGGPSGAHGATIGIDAVTYDGTTPTAVTGACCATDGTCRVTVAAACAGSGGTYRGDGSGCVSVQCASPAHTWVEQGEDAGPLPQSANITQGEGDLTRIQGNLDFFDDADLYQIRVCDAPSFRASTVGGSPWYANTQLFLFDANGLGVTFDDNDASSGTYLSTITGQFLAGDGLYYLGIATYPYKPIDSNNDDLWLDAPANIERRPDDLGALQPITGWNGAGGITGRYVITLQGACFAAPAGVPCYANCDGSTANPILNVQDFTCFLARFASGDAYSNCDGSTQAPALNVLDFSCFLQKFAGGCR